MIEHSVQGAGGGAGGTAAVGETSQRGWNGGRSQPSKASEAGSGLRARGSEGPAGFKQWSDTGTCILERALPSVWKTGLRNGERATHRLLDGP